MEPHHSNLDSVPYREYVVKPPPGFIPTPPITSYVPIEQSYHRLTKDDTNNFFEWTARQEAPMVIDSGESRPWRKGDPPIPKDVVMWIDNNGALHNSTITAQAMQIESLKNQLFDLQKTTEDRFNTIAVLLQDMQKNNNKK